MFLAFHPQVVVAFFQLLFSQKAFHCFQGLSNKD